MALHLWREPVTSRRADAWWAKAARAVARGRGLVITPANAVHAAWRAQLLAHGDDMLQGDVLLTPQVWCERMAQSATPLASTTDALLRMHAILQHAPLTHFDRLRNDFGIADILLTIMRRLQRAQIEPHALITLARDCGGERERDVANAYRAWCDETVGDGSIDHAALPAAVCALRKESPEIFLARLRQIANGADFPKLANRATHDDSFTLVIDLGLAPDPALLPIVSACSAIDGLTIHLTTCATDNALLAHWAKVLRASWQATAAEELCGATPSWQWRSALTMEQEVLTIAADIAEKIANGVELHRIAILAPTTEYRTLISRVLANAGLEPFSEALHPESVATLLHTVCAAFRESSPPTTRVALAAWGARGLEILHHARRNVDDASREVSPWLHARALRAQETLAQEFVRWQTAPSLAVRELTSSECSALLEWMRGHPSTELLAATQASSFITSHDIAPLQHMQCVYAPGLTRTAFPTRTTTLFFSGLERTLSPALYAAWSGIFPSADINTSRSYAAVSRWAAHANQLIISHARTDAHGRETFPADLTACAPEVRVDAPVEWYHLAASPRKAMLHADLPTTLAQRTTREREHRTALQSNEAPRALFTNTNVVEKIRAQFHNHTWSASALELFAKCPLRFAAEKILRLHTVRTRGPELDPALLGRWLHATLRWLYAEHAEDFRNASPDTTLLQTAITRGFAAIRDECSALLPAFHAHAARQILTWTSRVVRHDQARWKLDGAFFPQQYEHPFDLTLTTSLGPLRVRGSIDRIDVCAALQRFLIIDYKTGAEASIVHDIRNGAHVQLPLYASAARQMLTGWAPAGAVLYHVRDNHFAHGFVQTDFCTAAGLPPRVRSRVTLEAWNELCELGLTHAHALATQIMHAKIPYARHTCDACDWLGRTRHEISTLPAKDDVC